MRKNINAVILSGAVIFTVYLFIINSRQHPGDSIKMDEEQLYGLGRELNDHLSGMQVPDFSCINITGDSLMLSDLVAGRKVLVLYYSELHCSSCYESQFDLLQNNFPDTAKLLVLGSYLVHRNFKVYLNHRQYPLPFYRINYGSLDWYINEYLVPYFFILNKDLTASYFYIPDQTNIEKNRQYIGYVKNIIQQ